MSTAEQGAPFYNASTSYLDNAGLGHDLGVLIGWPAVAIIALPFSARIARRRAKSTHHHLEDVLGNTEADEAIAAAGAAAAAAV